MWSLSDTWYHVGCTTLMIILIALLFSNFIIILSLLQQQPAYSQESTLQTTNNNNNKNENFVIPLIIIGGIIWLIYKEFTKRYGKHRERRYFLADVKEGTKRKQHHKCAICKRGTGIWDFDHKDGNRYNNSPSNCQALCPTCHAKKTRGLLKQEKKFHLSWRIVVGVILFLLFLYVVDSYYQHLPK
jgi:HNH endonuclease